MSVATPKQKEQFKLYYLEHKEERKAYQKKWRSENRDKDLNNKRSYRKNNLRKVTIQLRDWKKKRKEEIVKLLGSKCKNCGFNDIRALQINHKEVKTKKRRQDFMNLNYDVSKIELLCANCHTILHHDFYRLNSRKYV